MAALKQEPRPIASANPACFKTPMKARFISWVRKSVMIAILTGVLKHAGLALAIGLGSCFNAAMLFRGLKKSGVYHPQPGWAPFFARILLALAVMGALIWYASGSIESWLKDSVLHRALHLMLIVILGASSYFATLRLVGVRLADFAKRGA